MLSLDASGGAWRSRALLATLRPPGIFAAETTITREAARRRPPHVDPLSAGAAQERYLARFHRLAEATGLEPGASAFDTE
jgi:hypothetical protein